MHVDALTQLLRLDHPGASAWRDNGRVCVAFGAGGRVYRYGDTVRGVAERLGLLRPVDHGAIYPGAIAELRATGETTTYLECADTIRYHASELSISYEPAGHDEYDRPLARYIVGAKSKWI